MATLVLDLSYYQAPREMDYDKIAEQIDGVILRAGYTGWGTGNSYYKDTAFEEHYKQFKARGVPVGAYWYGCADTASEGKAEAQWMIKNCLFGKAFELPIYWDTEDEHHQRPSSKANLTAACQAFCAVLEEAHYYVGIYASTSWLYSELNMAELTKYDVWVAHYGVSKPTYSGTYGMWQYTSSGKLKGYSGSLDLNYCYKDYPKIIKEAGMNGFTLGKATQSVQKLDLDDQHVLLCFKNDGDATNAFALQNALAGLCKSCDVRKGDPDVEDGRYIIQIGGAEIRGANTVLGGATRREVLVACGDFIRELTTL